MLNIKDFKLDKKFLLFMCFPAVILFGFLFLKLFTVGYGQEIILEVARPIDPVDLFGGNYVSLTYGISELDLMNVTLHGSIFEGNIIYAELVKDGDYWNVFNVYSNRFDINNETVCMKGTVTRKTDDSLRIKWGLEQFFLPPEMAKEVEKALGEGQVQAVVAVDQICNSVLKHLIVKGDIVKIK